MASEVLAATSHDLQSFRHRSVTVASEVMGAHGVEARESSFRLLAPPLGFFVALRSFTTMVCFLLLTGVLAFMTFFSFFWGDYDSLTDLARRPKVMPPPPRTFPGGMRSPGRMAGRGGVVFWGAGKLTCELSTKCLRQGRRDRYDDKHVKGSHMSTSVWSLRGKGSTSSSYGHLLLLFFFFNQT